MSTDVKNHEHMKVVKERVKKHEGYKNEVYEDTEGHLTVGVGYKLPKNSLLKTGDIVTDEFINEKFDSTFALAMEGAQRLLKDSQVKPEAFGVVTEMVFQMGETGVSKFKNTLDMIKNERYKEASLELFKGKDPCTVSKWAQQTPVRPEALSKVLYNLEDK